MPERAMAICSNASGPIRSFALRGAFDFLGRVGGIRLAGGCRRLEFLAFKLENTSPRVRIG